MTAPSIADLQKMIDEAAKHSGMDVSEEPENPEGDNLLEQFPSFFNKLNELVKNACTVCENPVGELRDNASIREARLSGMCQSCQDDFFGPEPKVEKVAAAEVEEAPEVEESTNELPEWIRNVQVDLG